VKLDPKIRIKLDPHLILGYRKTFSFIFGWRFGST